MIFNWNYSYAGGGWFRAKDVPKGEVANILHGDQAVDQAVEQSLDEINRLISLARVMKEELMWHNKLFEKLDRAMATDEQIERDLVLVGGFFSSLNQTETAAQIVDRAIALIKG